MLFSTVELGHFALWFALAATVACTITGASAYRSGTLSLVKITDRSAVVIFAACAVAFAILMRAYVISDFSVVNVADNSHSAKPLIYRISGTWGNHEGSLLLWLFILTLFTACIVWFGRGLVPRFRALVIAVQGLLTIAFLLFILLTSNPFERLFPAPVDGNGLNPLLQDVGLALHPPLLYVGYVGLSVSFSFAIAALIDGRVDSVWAKWMRPWTLVAWAFLTAGIALGSWWAYYELGWGGFWFWDPVENASLLPWLAATALLHSIAVVEKRASLKRWTIFLAIVAFSFSMLGTFLVRSGVLTSVHSFASDPSRGVFILMMLLVTIGGAFTLFAWRAGAMDSNEEVPFISREGAILINNFFLFVVTITVLLGTIYPLIIEAIGGEQISVGPPYYNKTAIPIMLLMTAMMALGPLLRWKRDDLGRLLPAFLTASIAAGALAAIWLLAVDPRLGVFAIGLFIGLLLAVGTLIDLFEKAGGKLNGLLRGLMRLPSRAWGMTVAHFGMAVVILGIVGAIAWEDPFLGEVGRNDSFAIGPYSVELIDVTDGDGPNYAFRRAEFLVRKTGDAEVLHQMSPEIRRYPNPVMLTTEAAIVTGAFADIFVTFTTIPERRDAIAVRAYHRPLQGWIWLGSILLSLGGLISLLPRLKRAPVSRSSERAAPPEAATPAE